MGLKPVSGFALSLSLSLCLSVQSLEADDDMPSSPFPTTLTLSAALEMLDDQHPDLQVSQSEIAALQADKLSLDANKAMSAGVRLEMRQVDRLADSGHRFVDDSRATLIIDKPVTNFGRDAQHKEAIDTELHGVSNLHEMNRSGVRIAAMKAFLDVIVADYGYAAIDEEMTLAFLRFNDARERMELYEEVAEVDVRGLEAIYLSALARRAAAANQQRFSRLNLALALNRPLAYPRQVVEPDMSDYQRELPDYDELFALVLERSPQIAAAQLHLQAMQQQYALSSRKFSPTLGMRFQAVEYAEEFSGSRDQYRAMFYLDVPIVSSAKNAGRLAKQQASIDKAQAELSKLEFETRREVLELVQQLAELNAQYVAAETDLLFRELALDKVRLLYEMEVKARIGSANADVAKALYQLKKVEYQRAIVWERIDALTRRTPVEFD